MKSILAVLLLFLFSNLALSQNTVYRIGSTVGNDEGRKSVIDDSDNVYVCGYFANTCNSSSTYSKTSAGGTDIYLAKYNCQGILQWVQSMGGVNSDNTSFHFLGLDIDNQNNVLLSNSIRFSLVVFHLKMAAIYQLLLQAAVMPSWLNIPMTEILFGIKSMVAVPALMMHP